MYYLITRRRLEKLKYESENNFRSQPEPKVENSYFELQQKHKVKNWFQTFIHIEGVSAKEMITKKSTSTTILQLF
jgi:hypothetical protein